MVYPPFGALTGRPVNSSVSGRHAFGKAGTPEPLLFT
ncbi:hypothetical protein X742_00905 [Mesorhizobium sp. LNHC232B00]|nr:hypothetical protein X742_00905 [Mesorhizobium sp. LNHC232B00]